MLKKHISADYSVFCIITTNYISSNSPVSESMIPPLPDCSCWSFANKSESKIREICLSLEKVDSQSQKLCVDTIVRNETSIMMK